MATLVSSGQTTAGAASDANSLLSFSQTAGNMMVSWVRGSANASATISAIYDNAGVNNGAITGSPTTTVIQLSAVSWTTNQFAGCGFVITASGIGANVFVVRTILSNTSDTVTLASALPQTPASGDTVVIGNLWTAVAGQAWTADGGAATSHAQWFYATNILAQSTNTTTIRIIWAGGNTANTITTLQFSGFDTGNPVSSATAASGSSATPTCGNLTSSVSGYLVAGYSTPTTAETWSNALDNAAGNSMTITQPAGTSRAATPTLVKGAGGTWAPRITVSTGEGWTATPLFINDTAAAGGIPPGLGPVVAMLPDVQSGAQSAMMR